ncbi:hypothetical protein BZA70DRAFT_272843 [Myxozyma melibiosi]|uniref:Anaphase-promoting complex subunit 4 WD40 domain-containing protein n=1 Tax=Myxozyma melibiosi TaxID=54550 RepID=A0ABR1FDZ4_9ASCO
MDLSLHVLPAGAVLLRDDFSVHFLAPASLLPQRKPASFDALAALYPRPCDPTAFACVQHSPHLALSVWRYDVGASPDDLVRVCSPTSVLIDDLASPSLSLPDQTKACCWSHDGRTILCALPAGCLALIDLSASLGATSLPSTKADPTIDIFTTPDGSSAIALSASPHDPTVFAIACVSGRTFLCRLSSDAPPALPPRTLGTSPPRHIKSLDLVHTLPPDPQQHQSSSTSNFRRVVSLAFHPTSVDPEALMLAVWLEPRRRSVPIQSDNSDLNAPRGAETKGDEDHEIQLWCVNTGKSVNLIRRLHPGLPGAETPGMPSLKWSKNGRVVHFIENLIVIYDVRRNNGARDKIATRPGTRIITMDLLRETGVAWVVDSSMTLHVYDLLQCTEHTRVNIGPAESQSAQQDLQEPLQLIQTPKHSTSPNKPAGVHQIEEAQRRGINTPPPLLPPSSAGSSHLSPQRHRSSPSSRSTRSSSSRNGSLRRQSSSDLFAYYMDQQSPDQPDDQVLLSARNSKFEKDAQQDVDVGSVPTPALARNDVFADMLPHPTTAIRATSPIWTYMEPNMLKTTADGPTATTITTNAGTGAAFPVVSIPDQHSLAVQELLLQKEQLELQERQQQLQATQQYAQRSPNYYSSASTPSTPAEIEPALPEPILPDCLFSNVGELMQESPTGLEFSKTGPVAKRALLEILFGWPPAFAGDSVRDVVKWELESSGGLIPGSGDSIGSSVSSINGSTQTFMRMVLNLWLRRYDEAESYSALAPSDIVDEFGETLSAIMGNPTSRAMTVSMSWLIFAMHLVGARDREEGSELDTKKAMIKKFTDEVLFRDKESYGDDVEAVHLATAMMIGCGLVLEAREIFRENAYYLEATILSLLFSLPLDEVLSEWATQAAETGAERIQIRCRNALSYLELAKRQQSAPLESTEPLFPRTPVSANTTHHATKAPLQRAATDTTTSTVKSIAAVSSSKSTVSSPTEVPEFDRAPAKTSPGAAESVTTSAEDQASILAAARPGATPATSSSRWRRPDLSIQLFKEDVTSFPARSDSLRTTGSSSSRTAAAAAVASLAASRTKAKSKPTIQVRAPRETSTAATVTDEKSLMRVSSNITRERTIISTEAGSSAAAAVAAASDARARKTAGEVTPDPESVGSEPHDVGPESAMAGERGNSAISSSEGTRPGASATTTTSSAGAATECATNAGSGTAAGGSSTLERRPTFLRSGMKRLLSTGSNYNSNNSNNNNNSNNTNSSSGTGSNTNTSSSNTNNNNNGGAESSSSSSSGGSIWRRLGTGSEKRTLFRSGSEQRAHEQALIDKSSTGSASVLAAAAAAAAAASAGGAGVGVGSDASSADRKRGQHHHSRRRSTVAFKRM